MHNRRSEFLSGSDPIKTDIVIEPSLAGFTYDLMSRIGFAGKRMLIVCDEHTHAALGKRLMNELSAIEPRLLILKGKVHADEASLKAIRERESQVLVGVGSGTISDLCKYASHLDSKPYAVFATAPSMNGYLSANASVTLNGVKESRGAHLPKGLFCDLSVISGAPKRLIQSGLGDSLCRTTAQADWLLSHLVLDTAYSPKPFEMLAAIEPELLAHAEKLVAGDIAVIEMLMRTLILSGIGMTLAGGSYPASQGEHMIAHTMEMKHEDKLPETYHGEQIGVTTLTMAKIQHEALSRALRLPPCPRWEEALVTYFGSTKGRPIADAARKKYALYDRYETIVAKLTQNDAQIRDAIKQVLLPEEQLRSVLLKADAKTSPKELGWSDGDYDIAVSRARFARDRFTFLDLL